jgi:hypothetical protein
MPSKSLPYWCWPLTLGSIEFSNIAALIASNAQRNCEKVMVVEKLAAFL